MMSALLQASLDCVRQTATATTPKGACPAKGDEDAHFSASSSAASSVARIPRQAKQKFVIDGLLPQGEDEEQRAGELRISLPGFEHSEYLNLHKVVRDHVQSNLISTNRESDCTEDRDNGSDTAKRLLKTHD